MWFRKKGCHWVEGVLSEYLNRNLSSEDTERVGHHLTQCQKCREDYEHLKLTIDLVKHFPQVPVPRSFAVQPTPQAERRPIRAVLLRPVALSAVAVLVLTLVYVIPENLKEGQEVMNPSLEDLAPAGSPLPEVELSLSKTEKPGAPISENLKGEETAPPKPTPLLSEGMEISPPTHPLPSHPVLEPGGRVLKGANAYTPNLCLPCIGCIA
jgi:hypothetical protein